MADQPAAGCAPLRNLWYFALPGAKLRSGCMVAKTMLGEPILLARDSRGQALAVADRCPCHGDQLTHGRFDGAEITCRGGGCRFDLEGRGLSGPAPADGDGPLVRDMALRRYPCREVQGLVWVFVGDEGRDPGDPPAIPDIGNRHAPRLVETQLFDCALDHAVVGLVDPAHVNYVHTNWWWRSKRTVREKAKLFAPTPLGFKMVRHKPSSNTVGYKILGGEITTEITFQLPGIRLEHIRAGRHVICNLTTATPTGHGTTELNNSIYWTQPWLAPLTPLVRHLAKVFLGQDGTILAKQKEGLRYGPPLMLVGEVDAQAKWYYRLKQEWQRCEREGDAFVNPLRERTLRWRS